MEAVNNQGNASLPSTAPASGDGDAIPLKLYFEKLSLEVALPRPTDGELSTALQRALDRFSDVMERWLERSLASPGWIAPPMPWMTAPPSQAQQSAALPIPAAAPAVQTPVVPTSKSPSRSLPTVSPQRVAHSRATDPPRESVETNGASVSARGAIRPEEVPPLLVEDSRPHQAATITQDAPARESSEERVSEARPSPSVNEATAPDTAKDADAAEQALLQLQEGERHRVAGSKKDALACYEGALALDPDCPQAYLGRASIYIEQGRLDEALLDCNSALKRQPERAVLYVLRGLVYARFGNVKRALDEAEDALRLDPRLPSAYMLRGSARFTKGMKGEALADVKQAIVLRPGDAKFRAELARLLAEMGHHEQAARVYAKVLELAPGFHEARLLRGAALRQAGELADAEAELTEYLRRRPRTAAAHYQRGLCRLAQRNYAQAMTDFDKAIALNPDDKAVYQAKQKTLEQWEGTARQSRALNGSAATVALAAMARDEATAETANASTAPLMPTATKSRPGKYKPSPSPLSWQGDYAPRAWLRPAKWACALLLVGVLSFGGFRVVANFIHDPNQMDEIPSASVKLSAEQLFERYKTDPDAAKTELSDRVIEVTGMVTRQLEDKTPTVVFLYTGSPNVNVKCTLKDNLSYRQQMQLARIEEYCKVTFVGKCAGPQENSVAVNECYVGTVIRRSVRTRR
jgi:tetratricopeptide (TPR) repeat protein